MEMKKYKLGEIADIIVGYPFESAKFNTDGNGVLLVRGMNVSERFLRFGDEARYWNYITDDLKPYYLKENDIVIGMDGSKVGKNFALVKKEDLPLVLVQRVACIRAKRDYDQRYIWQYVSSKRFIGYVNTIKTGSSIPHISGNQISNFPIFVPDLQSQQKIAAVLSTLDDKIALNRRINAKLEQMAKRLYDHCFVQFDFPNADGKPYKSSGGKMEYNEVLKREIPIGWDVGILSDIANITMGQSPEGSSYNEDGKGTIFYQGSTDFGIRFPTVRMYTTEPTRFAKKGDILMSVRAPVGAVNIANTDCCIGRGLAALNSKIGSITHLWYLMDVFKHTFENKNAAGTTFGSITKDELYNLPVVIPQKEIIFAFNEKTFSIFNYQLSIEKETQKLTALRDRLLPLLMNGQVQI